MKNFNLLVTLFMLCSVAFSTISVSQEDSFCGVFPPHEASNPDGEIIYDRFGNTYNPEDLLIENLISISNNGPENDCDNSGFFELFFDESVPQEWESTICQVFADITQDLIERPENIFGCGQPSPLEPVKVCIDILPGTSTSTVLATATSYLRTHLNPCNETAIDFVFQKINGGEVLPEFPDLADGLINIKNISTWNTDLTSDQLPIGVYDLYSVVLHEALHLLGFSSSIDRTGVNQNLLTQYDKLLYVENGFSNTPVFENDCASNCNFLNAIFNDQNDLVDAVTNNCLSGEELKIIVGNPGFAAIVGGNGIAPTGVDEEAIDFDFGRMLSHLHPDCVNENSFIMQTALAPQEVRRDITPEEKGILCSIGYTIKSGNNFSGCEGCYIVPFPDQWWYTAGPDDNLNCCIPDYHFSCLGETVLFEDFGLLCNDFTNGQSLEIVDLGLIGSSTGVSISNNEISFSEAGIFRFYYSVKGCDCKIIDGGFEVMVGNCVDCIADDPCINLSCEHDFENYDVGGFSLPFELGYWAYDNDQVINSVFALNNSPDICEFNGNNYLHMGSNIISNTEAIVIPLKEEIPSDCFFDISFMAAISNDDFLNIYGSEHYPCTSTDALIPFGCNIIVPCQDYDYNPRCIDNVFIDNIVSTTTTGGIVCADNPTFQEYQIQTFYNSPSSPPIKYIIFSPPQVSDFFEGMSVFLDHIIVTSQCLILNPTFSYNIPCPKTQFTSNESFEGYDHFWDFGDGNTSSEANPCHTYLENGTYEVTHTITDECGNMESHTEIITVECEDPDDCPHHNFVSNYVVKPMEGEESITLTEAIATTPLPAPPFGAWDEQFEIEGTLIIDQDYQFVFGTKILMRPGSQIIVNPDITLVIVGAELFGCDQMWKGIKILPEGTLGVNQSAISDAQYAVEPTPNSVIDIKFSRFDRNYVSLRYSNGGGTFDLGSFYGNTIDCAEELLASFPDQFPTPQQYSYAGIDVNNNINLFIGVEGEAINEFKNLRNGILVSRTNLQVLNSRFENIQEGEYSISGNGIRTSSDGSTFFRQRGFGKYEMPSFENVTNGITSFRNVVDFIEQNNMQNVIRGIAPWLSNVKVNVEQNQIVLGQQSSPFLNEQGIFYWGYFGPTDVLISGNEIIGDHSSIGIECSLGEANPIYVTSFEVSNNFIYFDGFIQFIGIAMSNLRGANITNNHIFSEGFGFDFTGISMQVGEGSTLNCNEINGSGASTSSRGIDVISSPMYQLTCNDVKNTREGIRFTGDCYSENKFLGNRFEHHAIGLAVSNLSSIGTQENTGNKWVGADDDYIIKARHEQTDNGTVPNPFLYVDESQFSVNATQTLFPEFEAITDDWFNLSGGTTYICDVPLVLCPIDEYIPEFTPFDEKIAIGDFDSSTENPLIISEYKRNLYKKVTDFSEMITSETIPIETLTFYDEFYEAEALTAIGQFEQLENDIRALWDISDENYQDLSQNFATLLEQADELTLIDNQLNDSSGNDSLSLLIERIQILQSMQELTSSNQILTQAIWNNCANEATNLITENLNLPNQHIFEKSEQMYHEVYLTTLPNGLIEFTEEQLTVLEKIAYQCPDVWGLSVYKARNLLSLHESRVFDNEELCGGNSQGLISNAVNFNFTTGLVLSPNPTKDEVKISYPYIEEGNGFLRIISLSGQVHQEIDLSANTNKYRLLVGDFTQGIYWVQFIKNDTLMHTEKLVIIK